jgi:hypothetical protein
MGLGDRHAQDVDPEGVSCHRSRRQDGNADIDRQAQDLDARVLLRLGAVGVARGDGEL